MYKVFKDNCLFILASSNDIPHVDSAITICVKKPNDIINIIDSYNDDSVIIVLHHDIEALIQVFESNYKIRIAAGGWVYNNEGSLLLINRFNHWDVPKGHIDDGETIEQCAIREVEEETNVGDLIIDSYLGVSMHLFSYNDNPQQILKVTHWYKMQSDFKGDLIPQLAEGITKVRWVNKNELETILPLMWYSLSDFYYSFSKKNLFSQYDKS